MKGGKETREQASKGGREGGREEPYYCVTSGQPFIHLSICLSGW